MSSVVSLNKLCHGFAGGQAFLLRSVAHCGNYLHVGLGDGVEWNGMGAWEAVMFVHGW